MRALLRMQRLLLVIGGFLAVQDLQAGSYYYWVDDEGMMHVTTDFPIGRKYVKLNGPDPVRWYNAPPLPPEVSAGDATADRGAIRKASDSVYMLFAVPERSGARVSLGSAVAITDRLLLTTCHVILGAGDQIFIQGNATDGSEQASVEGAAFEKDRCVLRVRRMDLHPVAGLRKYDTLEVGEKVFAIGNPSGLSGTVTDGVLSAKRESADSRFLQTSAAISPGSSGGGLFDERGNLIGITAFMIKNAQGLNFAIPAEDFWP